MDARLTTKQLAERWGYQPGTLVNWRHLGLGPRFVKLRSKVVYRLADIEAYERAGLVIPK